MSRILVSKLDVDVLVQLALAGPAGVTEWQALTDEPDALGTALWRLNYEVAGWEDEDPPPPEYRFAPLPITVTALEGVRQCEYYAYQTASQDDVWRKSEVRRVLGQLGRKLVAAAVEEADGPWGWDAAAVAARADRPAPQLPTAEVVDARVARLLARWQEADLPLTLCKASPERIAELEDPRDLLTCAYVDMARPGWGGVGPVVALYDDDTAADVGFVGQVSKWAAEHSRQDVHVYRFGPTVVTTSFQPWESPVAADTATKLAQFGPPDEVWSNTSPAVEGPRAEVRATGVRLRPWFQDGQWAYCARTRGELDALAEVTRDEDVAEVVRALNPRKHSALLLCGISEIAAVGETSIVEAPEQRGAARVIGHELVIEAETPSTAIGTLLVLDRLSVMPTIATLHHGSFTRIRVVRPA